MSEIAKRKDMKLPIHTFSSRTFELLDMLEDESLINREDIIHNLAIFPRWNGASIYPYTIGQHTLVALEILQNYYGFLKPKKNKKRIFLNTNSESEFNQLKLMALHDASEAYIGDIISPLKEFLYIKIPKNGKMEKLVEKGKKNLISMEEFELSISRAIYNRFHVICYDPKKTKYGELFGDSLRILDVAMAFYEAKYIFNPPLDTTKWNCRELEKVQDLNDHIEQNKDYYFREMHRNEVKERLIKEFDKLQII